MREFIATNYEGPVGPTRERPMISSVRLDEGPGHDVVHVWNRGGKAGELTVDKGDGLRLVERLFGPHPYRELV